MRIGTQPRPRTPRPARGPGEPGRGWETRTAARLWFCEWGHRAGSSCTPPPPSPGTAVGSAACSAGLAGTPGCGWSVAVGQREARGQHRQDAGKGQACRTGRGLRTRWPPAPGAPPGLERKQQESHPRTGPGEGTRAAPSSGTPRAAPWACAGQITRVSGPQGTHGTPRADPEQPPTGAPGRGPGRPHNLRQKQLPREGTERTQDVCSLL